MPEDQGQDQDRHQDAAGTFEAHRRHLFGLAYRLLGSAADADDVMQDAFLRWNATDRAAVANPAAWLTRVVTNLCLTELTSARQRRERYTGTWLPEPVLTGADAAAGGGHGELGPLETVQQRESVSMAMLLLLEELTPPERAVFILHEAFGYRYAEIAEILGKTEAACRQLARRAARRIGPAAKFTGRFTPSARDEQARWHRLTDGFLAAAAAGDVAALEKLLAQDVVSWSDGGGKFPAGARPVLGRHKVARVLAALGYALGSDAPAATGVQRALAAVRAAGLTFTAAEVNGSPALLGWSGGAVFAVIVPVVTADGITALYSVANPDKLTWITRQASRNAGPPSQ
ncbi:MAG TPA: RNA polymerase sigma factor SigJ [Trebonia sp.]|jgi:RNA polymerase sigma factor (sigma-70 family)|nr:RNA polymerase sigma factor SigJ [Trebonia sp.]